MCRDFPTVSRHASLPVHGVSVGVTVAGASLPRSTPGFRSATPPAACRPPPRKPRSSGPDMSQAEDPHETPAETTLSVEVWRGRDTGSFTTYRVPPRANQTVLDVVTWIQRHAARSEAHTSEPQSLMRIS